MSLSSATLREDEVWTDLPRGRLGNERVLSDLVMLYPGPDRRATVQEERHKSEKAGREERDVETPDEKRIDRGREVDRTSLAQERFI